MKQQLIDRFNFLGGGCSKCIL